MLTWTLITVKKSFLPTFQKQKLQETNKHMTKNTRQVKREAQFRPTKQGESIRLTSEAGEERAYQHKLPSYDTGEAPKSTTQQSALTCQRMHTLQSSARGEGRVSPSGTAKIELHVRNDR